jgi:hypothetical protein
VVLRGLVVDDVSVVGFALRLDVGSEVAGSLVISISGTEMSSFERRELFVPSVITFSSSSPFLTSSWTYLPVAPEPYRLDVALSGSSSGDYKVVFPAGDLSVLKEVEPFLLLPMELQWQIVGGYSPTFLIYTADRLSRIAACGRVHPLWRSLQWASLLLLCE